MKRPLKNKIIFGLSLAAVGILALALFVFRDGSRKNQLVVQSEAGASEKTAPSLNKQEKDNSSATKAVPNPKTASARESAVPAAPASSDSGTNQAAPSVKTSTTSTPAAGAPKIINNLVSWGFAKTSGRVIDTIIIHSSYNATGGEAHSVEGIINNEYKPNGVSPHYIIGRDGTIYRLVLDQDIAYHAGVSKLPDGRTNVNNFSLGIEIVEAMSESPSAAQYASLNSLLDYLHAKYSIKHILGHSDIAPGRKTDPWNFNWNKIQLGKME
ncbi:MAG: N-acetylmuramoyl-L-alanine amidase [Candidatus Pacebacteria bacterium]|nr:N-acetylmuramoyl-L-alanine amidase [Candidatus Paceibacterota bacterium]MDR3583633.1 N-acetylmuramoyl-L-alanine amidase [Candidatus Paceibacterota bacterium]